MDISAYYQPIAIGVITTIIIALLSYLVKIVLDVHRLLERHEKVLFGDKDIEDWEGLVKICLANRKYSINDRRAFIALISILCKNNQITMDEELKEAIETLKKE